METAETEDRLTRPLHVQMATAHKRLLLTREMLDDIGYEDVGALELLREGAALAGDIPATPVFKAQFKPCLTTVTQLKAGAYRRNQFILGMAKSSGDKLLDEQILKDTEEEVSKGWALGPIAVEDIPEGAVISKRFALRQGVKTRLIDDFSISGVNKSCVTHNKVDLHMIDTFCAVLKKYFMEAGSRRLDPELVAKFDRGL